MIDLVRYEGAAIWLYRRLKTANVINMLPGDFRETLRDRALDDTSRRLDVEAEAGAVLALLNTAGIPVILLKGLARCALAARYPYLDARSTIDVDLLVSRDRIDDADRVLRADGYRPALPDGEEYPGHHHLPPLCKGPITVELHSSTSARATAEVAWQRANDGAETLSWGNQLVRVPSPTELAWHAIVHAMEDGVYGFRLTRFLEVAALVASDAPIDWTVIRERSATNEARDPETNARDQQAVVLAWLNAAFTLVDPARRPPGFEKPVFTLTRLLQWRLSVLPIRPRVGPEISGHLLQEGPRAMLHLPLRASPANASWLGKMRRPLAGTAARLAYGLWRLGK